MFGELSDPYRTFGTQWLTETAGSQCSRPLSFRPGFPGYSALLPTVVKLSVSKRYSRSASVTQRVALKPQYSRLETLSISARDTPSS